MASTLNNECHDGLNDYLLSEQYMIIDPNHMADEAIRRKGRKVLVTIPFYSARIHHPSGLILARSQNP